MDPISISSGIAGLISLALQISKVIGDYSSAVKEGPKNIEELKNELILIGEVLSQLQDFLRSEKAAGRSFDSNSVLQASISSCKVRIERIGDKLKTPDGGKISRMVDRFRWPFQEKEVAQMVTNLRAYTAAFQFSLTIEGCNVLAKNSNDAAKGLQLMLDTSQKIHELSLQMGGMSAAVEETAKRSAQLAQLIRVLPLLAMTVTEIQEISQGMRIAELREQERRTTDILDWLAPISSLQKHGDVQGKRTPGTGGWFLQTRDFLDWACGQSENNDLLCVGNPGVGKTVLTSLVIDHLRQMYNKSDVCVAYYYLDFSEQQSQTPLNFARTLLRQLCSQCNAIPTTVVDFYRRTKNDVKDQTWFFELQGILHRVAATFARCYIVVDAFDETESREQRSGLLEVLKNISNQSSTKIFASLRPHVQDVRNAFQSAVEIEVSAKESDLRAYLSSMIDSHPESEYIMDESLKIEILDRLCGNSHGMFLLPVLQVRSILLDQFTKSEVRRALRNLSTDISQVFHSTIARIQGLSGNRRSLALKTMMWISHAKRALTVDELRHALAVRLEDNELDTDNLLSIRTVLDSCFGLVVLDTSSSKLRFVHFTLEEYLRSDHGLFENADLEVTQTCLRYMTFESVKALPGKNRTDFTNALVSLPFLDYAAQQWGFHAQNVPIDDIKDLALTFLESEIHLLAIARVRDHKQPDFRKWKERMMAWAFSEGAGISLAASFGLSEIIRILIQRSPKPMLMARNVYGSTPLHEAAIKGYEETAKVLLEHGADLLDSNNGKNTPFYLAVAYRQLPVAKMLLTYGIDQVNIACRGGWTPLHNAADLGNDEMITLLLQSGAQIAVTNDKDLMPLHLAARHGHLSAVRLLVSAGAPVHIEKSKVLQPLDFAAIGGNVAIVAFLVDNGANIRHKADQWTAIHRAARGGHAQVVELLIEKGADLLVKDHKGNIPLHLAARSGHLDTVKIIVNSRPEIMRDQVFAKDRKGSTPRAVAFYTAQYHVHKYLRAVEMELLGTSELPSAFKLSAAIEQGDFDSVRSLLNSEEIDIEMPDDNGQPPLHVAIQEERQDITELLLEHGASIESVGFHQWRPLHIAASLGNIQLVELCLRYRADVHTISSTRQSALHKACSGGSPGVVRLLLEAGADPEAQNDRGMRPLHVAVHQNDPEIVRILIQEWNVSIRPRDRFHDTPAAWAERSGHLEILEYLAAEERKRQIAAESLQEF